MADIVDEVAIEFSNTQVRVLADLLANTFSECRKITEVWTSQSMGSKIPNTSDVLADRNPAGDGRSVITGININNIINRAIEFRDDYEASNDAKLNTVLQVAVNP